MWTRQECFLNGTSTKSVNSVRGSLKKMFEPVNVNSKESKISQNKHGFSLPSSSSSSSTDSNSPSDDDE